jgi:hypothetical protein
LPKGRPLPELSALEDDGHRVVLSRGRLSAAAELAVGELGPRRIRDAFDRLIAAAEALQVPRLTHVHEKGDAERCPYCHDALGDALEEVACVACGTTHHAACAAELHGCTVMGCTGHRWQRVRA